MDPKQSDAKSQPSTFLELYRAGCAELKAEPDADAYYKILDTEWARMAQSGMSADFLAALHPDRLAIALPCALVAKVYPGLPDWFSDAESADGASLYFSSPGLDTFRVNVIRSLAESAARTGTSHPFFRSENFCVKWLLARLEKRAKLGWEGYRASYLEGLRS
jgi:hypothetical protein